jgi:hypothetical protein
MVIATLCNASQIDAGSVEISFPVEEDKMMAELEKIHVGNGIEPSCLVQNIGGAVPALKIFEGKRVNPDEMNYLARRLDSFDPNELLQFQGAIARDGLHTMKDLINLTFNVSDYAVVSDFSKLEKADYSIYFAQHGGIANESDLKKTDLRALAAEVLSGNGGAVTPYGVVYKFDGTMDEIYNGRNFPQYDHDCDNILIVGLKSKNEAPSTQNIEWLYMPMPEICMEKALLRIGENAYSDVEFLPEVDGNLPDGLVGRIDLENETMQTLNDMCKAVYKLSEKDLQKLDAVADYAKADSALQIMNLAKNLDLFEFVPDVESAEEYGRYMIRDSGHFEYDDNLAEFYDYRKYGEQKLSQEDGEFNFHGYICYTGATELDELMRGADQEGSEIASHSPQLGM